MSKFNYCSQSPFLFELLSFVEKKITCKIGKGDIFAAKGKMKFLK